MTINADDTSSSPKLYAELASWWHLLSAPEDYAEEAEFLRCVLTESCEEPPRTLLELGSGGGNNASHLKRYFRMTLTDLSPEMLTVSRDLNPDCEHIQGDMRSLRLGRLFDAVFIHDAIEYMLSDTDLRSAIEVAYLHCRPGGAALFAPDCVRETFLPKVKHGGHDGEGRGLRYLEWTYDPDPADTTYVVDFIIMLREGEGPVRVERDRHICGVFARSVWLQLLRDAGFEPRIVSDPYDRELFLGIKHGESMLMQA